MLSADFVNAFYERVGFMKRVMNGDPIHDELEMMLDHLFSRIDALEIAVSNLTEETFGVDES